MQNEVFAEPFSYLLLRFFRFLVLQADPLKIRTDKQINIAIHHRIHIAIFRVRPMILDERVRLHDVGADLVAEIDILDIAADVGQLLGVLLLFEQVQLGF